MCTGCSRLHPSSHMESLPQSLCGKETSTTYRISCFLNHLQTNFLVKVDNCHIFHSRTSPPHTQRVKLRQPDLFLRSCFNASSSTTRLLTCPRHPSEAEAAPHPWPRPARGRPCHRLATGRAAPPEDRHLGDGRDRSGPPLLTTDYMLATESQQEMH